MFVTAIKQRFKTYCPRLFYALKSVRANARYRRDYREESRAARVLARMNGRVVLGGPFRGMRYVGRALCSTYAPKLVGSYEEELYPHIERAIRLGYKTVIDVGCAEGFYAVGMALRLPNAKVHAFDTDPEAQHLCHHLARLNLSQSQVSVHGTCTPQILNDLCRQQCLLICDCEGYELELLNPLVVPNLAKTDVIVELHDLFIPGLTDQILSRFETTHFIEIIESRDRDPASYPVLECVRPEDRSYAVSEGRLARMQWAIMTSRSAGVDCDS